MAPQPPLLLVCVFLPHVRRDPTSDFRRRLLGEGWVHEGPAHRGAVALHLPKHPDRRGKLRRVPRISVSDPGRPSWICSDMGRKVQI